MALVNSSISDITADVTLADSKSKIKGNDDKLLANDVAIDSRLVTAEGKVNSSLIKFTAEGGLAIRIINKTGVASVKGSVVSASTVTAESFMLQASELDAMGIVYESGIADASLCWVVVSGIAEVLLKDTTASTLGHFAYCSATDGRMETKASPTNADEHFKEIGHCIETKIAGNDVLAKVILHFN